MGKEDPRNIPDIRGVKQEDPRNIPDIRGVKQEDPRNIPDIRGVKQEDPRNIPDIRGVKVEVLKEGWRFQLNDKTTRIYPRIDLCTDSKYSIDAAQELGVDPSDILKAQYEDIERELTIEELSGILDSTIKKDKSTKVIAFLNALLTFTDRNQSNMALQGESSGGKSYLVQELLDYFPKEDITFYGGASPTSFFHEQGVIVDGDTNEPIDFTQKPGPDATPEEREAWAERMRNSRILVDLEKKILVFLDQPHYKLLEYLRPLLSHDRKEIEYSITDKSEKMGLRTKKVRLRGFPTVFFCSTKSTMDDQEKTRMFLLSPETSPTKINETIDLLALKCCNTGQYEEDRKNDARRVWLSTRVARIKAAGIRDVIIEDPKAIGDRFKETHRHLVPRHQRDFPRLIGLIKGHALLNEHHREHIGEKKDIIKANQTDIYVGFTLYESIATSNELGLTPETWEIYEKVMFPWLGKGLEKKDILYEYRRVFHRALPARKLADEILPTLEGAGLITKEEHPTDKRKYVVYPLDIRDISGGEGVHPPDVRDISRGEGVYPLDVRDISRGEGVYPPDVRDISGGEGAHPPDVRDISGGEGVYHAESARGGQKARDVECYCSECYHWQGAPGITEMAFCPMLKRSTAHDYGCPEGQLRRAPE